MKGEMLQNLFELLSDKVPAHFAYVQATDQKYIYANESFCRLFGLSKEEIRGRSIREVIGEESYRTSEPLLKRVGAGEELYYEGEFHTSEGKRLARVHYFPHKTKENKVSGILVYAEDMTEARSFQQGLRQSEHRFRNLVIHSSDLFFMTDTKQHFTYMSPQIEQILGYTPEEIEGPRLKLLFDTELNNQARLTIQRMLETGRKEKPYIVQLRRKDGSICYLEVDESPMLDKSGAVVGLVGAGRDISARFMANEELKRINQELEHSHSLIVAEEEKLRTLIQNIPGAVYRCMIDPDWTMVYLSPYFEKVSGYKPEAVLYNTERSYNSLIHPGDREYVRETVENAIAGNQSFELQYRIRHKDGHWVWLYEKGTAVTGPDTGERWLDGVLFDETEKKKAEQELILAKEKAEESERLKSTFLLQGQEIAAHGKIEDHRSASTPADSVSLKGKHILIVEDENYSFLFMQELLQGVEVEVLRARDGLEAIDRVQENPGIDLVLMDIKLPRLNGLEATRRIKEKRAGLPVIAVTAYAMAGDKEMALEAGCDAYIAKPVDLPKLFHLIKSLIAEAAARNTDNA